MYSDLYATGNFDFCFSVIAELHIDFDRCWNNRRKVCKGDCKLLKAATASAWYTAGFRYIMQATASNSNLASCPMQFDLVETCAPFMQRPKLLHCNSSHLQRNTVSSRQAPSHHRKPSRTLLNTRSRYLTSGNPTLKISMDNNRLSKRPRTCSTKHHMLP